jgi:thiopurine S-methyltransferase
MYHFDDWQRHWLHDDTPWTGQTVNDFAAEYLPRLKQKYALPSDANVLIPLAGNSSAVRFYYEQGFAVSAVEYVPAAVEQLRKTFPELTFETQELSTGRMFSAPRLRIYQQDFFAFAEPQRYDLVFDRGAFVAIQPKERPRYAEILVQSMKPGALLLIRTAEFLDGIWRGPPYSVTEDQLSISFAELDLVEKEKHEVAPTQERYLEAGVRLIRHWIALFRKPA